VLARHGRGAASVRKRTAEALEKGVFGSPFFLVGRESFWGWDRLPMIEAWLERRALEAAKPSTPGTNKPIADPAV
jgi:hypothetical protein